MEFVLGKLYAHTHIHSVYYTTHKVMTDKKVDTGYERTMLTHRQTHAHTDAVTHMDRQKHSHTKHSHAHTQIHIETQTQAYKPDVDKGGCTRQACTSPLSFKSQLLYYLH